ncbi:glycosyl hydrolase family 28-related protein [Streptomyces sp. NPDC003328]
MARNLFGGSAADVAETSDGIRVPGANGTVWDGPDSTAQQITDLINLDGLAITTLTADPQGMIPQFMGPDGAEVLYLDFGAGRVAVTPVDIGTRFRAHVTGLDPHGDRAGAVADVQALRGISGGFAALDGNGLVPVANLPGAREVINVKTAPYGAKGDGTTDDTAAIQAAINAGAIVYFPPGNYVTGTLTMRPGTTLIGSGAGGTFKPVADTMMSVLKLKSGTNGHLIYGPADTSWVRIRDLRLDGNSTANTAGDLIHLDSAPAQDTSWYITECSLDNSPGDGINIGSGRQAVKVSRTWIMRSKNNGVTLNGADGGLESVLIGLSGANGVYIGGWVEHLSNCDIWSSTANGVVCDNVNMVTLVNCGIDRHRQSGLVQQGGGAVSVIGCNFHSNSQAADNTYPHISLTAGAMTVVGTQFATDNLANNPDWAIKPVGSVALLEWGNRVLAGATIQGFISDPSKTQYAIPFGGQLNIGASGSPAAVAIRRNFATDAILSGRAASDTQTRYFIDASGAHSWGSGSATGDTNMYRPSAGVLATDNTLGAKNGLQVGSVTPGLGGGVGVAGISNATTVPTTNPTGGGVLYAEGGALKWRGSNGTVTVIGPA